MKAKEVIKLLRITRKTLYNYISQGKIRYISINKNHYIYNDDDVYNLIGKNIDKNSQRFNVIYSRVSLYKQKNDLKNQTQRLKDFAISNGIIISEVLEDVKSGMNFNNRKNFNKLIDLVFDSKIDTIIIENNDRLTRFGFELLQNIFSKFGTKIISTSSIEDKNYEQELTDDMLAIIHYFSMKSYSHRRKLNKMKNILTKNIED